VALVAGGGVIVAAQLAAAMLFLQFAIGAVNDIVDAPADAGRVPPKPIPAGLVTMGEARGIAALSAAMGLVIAPQVGLATLFLGLLVLAVGAAYDLFAKGTPWSWLPFVIGIPILPVYGWLGATGSLPPSFAILIPMAMLAGAGLAVANARADLATDLASGTQSVATRLGAERSWWAGTGLLTAAVGLGLVGLVGAGVATASWGIVIGGVALVAVGLGLGLGEGHSRRRAWEVQAVGAAIAAIGWLWGMNPGD
jgi:4-hydroxybenzoate polyprenyltransferase